MTGPLRRAARQRNARAARLSPGDDMLGKTALAGLLLTACLAHGAEDGFPGMAQSYLVKRDGHVLWAHDAQSRHAPASLAKMMTALLVLEEREPNEVVTVSRAASRETGSRIRLKAGEQLRVQD